MAQAKKSSRRWLKVLLAMILVLGLGWHFGKGYLDIERYRALAAEEIQRRTGLPTELGKADLRLWPTPRFVLDGAVVGEEGFRIRTRRIEAQASLRQLFNGELSVSEISIGETVIDLPADSADFAARIQALRDALAAAAESGGGSSAMALAVTIGHVNAKDWLLRRGGEDLVRGSASVTRVLSGTPEITVDLDYAPTSGTTATGVVGIDMRGEAPTLSGELKFSAADLWALAGQKGSAPLRATATGTLSGTLPSQIGIDISGKLDASQTPALTGTLLAKAWYTDGQIVVNDIAFDAPALKANADLTRDTNGALNFAVREASLNAEGITLAAAFTPVSDQFNLGGKNAALHVNDLLGTVGDAGPRLVRGTVSVEGMRVNRPSSDLVLEGVAGNLRIEENVITLEKLSAPGLEASGTLRPDLDTKAVAFDLRTGITLDDTLLAMLYPIAEVNGVGGRVELKRVAGTWKPGLALPEGLIIEGTVTGAKANLAYPAFTDTFSGGAATFTSDGKTVKADLNAASAKLGPVKGTANVDIAAKTISGIMNLDIARAAAPFIPESDYSTTATAVLKSYGDSALEYKLDLPSAESTAMRLVALRRGTPALDANLQLLSGAGGMSITGATLRGDVDTALAKDALPESAYARGLASVSVTAARGLNDLDVFVDLARATVGYATYAEKAAGAPLSAKLRIAKQGDSFAVDDIRVNCLGETVLLKQSPAGLRADDFAIQLAALRPLFPAGASAQGVVRGSLTLADSPAASLRFEEASVRLPQGITIDRLHGAVSGGGGAWTCTELTLVGLNSDATFNGTLRDSAFNATVRGKRVDGTALMGLAALFKAAEGSGEAAPATTLPPANRGTSAGRPRGTAGTPGAAPSAAGKSTLHGEATLDVAALAYQNGEVSNLKAMVRMADGIVTVDDLVCRPKTGSAKGVIRYDTATGAMTTKLNLENADISLIDSMLLKSPRGIEGTVTGTVDLRMTGETGKGPLSGLNGDIKYVAQSGSYGKVGIATKLLSVLRTTQILQLSRPKLGQSGLVYETSSAEVVIQDGVINIRNFELAEPSYTVTATGYIDLPNDDMNAVVRASVFDTVTGIVAAVPGLRDATERIRKMTTLKITLTGSPRNPNVKEEHGASITEAASEGAEGARETVKTTEDLVRDGLRQLLDRVQR